MPPTDDDSPKEVVRLALRVAPCGCIYVDTETHRTTLALAAVGLMRSLCYSMLHDGSLDELAPAERLALVEGVRAEFVRIADLMDQLGVPRAPCDDPFAALARGNFD